MAARDRPLSTPVRVAVSAEQRRRIAAEAERRGLGVSPTIRTLALERLADIDETRQLARARKWQLEQALRALDDIERGDVREVPWSEIEALFDESLASGSTVTTSRDASDVKETN